jgi:hypothetical protein
MIRKVARILLNCIREGVDDGTFKEDTNPFLIRSMILGSIEHLCTRKLLLGSPSDLVAFADPMIDAILAGIKMQPKQLSMNLSLNNADIIKSLISNTLPDAKDAAPKRKKASRK